MLLQRGRSRHGDRSSDRMRRSDPMLRNGLMSHDEPGQGWPEQQR
jgi:hypothetical protein